MTNFLMRGCLMILPLHFGDAVEAELKCLLSSSALKSTSRAKTFCFYFRFCPLSSPTERKMCVAHQHCSRIRKAKSFLASHSNVSINKQKKGKAELFCGMFSFARYLFVVWRERERERTTPRSTTHEHINFANEKINVTSESQS